MTMAFLLYLLLTIIILYNLPTALTLLHCRWFPVFCITPRGSNPPFLRLGLIIDRIFLQKLRWMVSEGIVRGYVRPITRVTYAPYEVPHALRLLAASRHRGRVLLRLWDYALSAQPR